MYSINIPERTFARLLTVLQSESTIQQALLYGSRARGHHRENSDVDIALVGEKIPRTIRGRLQDAAGLYTLDVVMLNEIENEELIKNIENDSIIIYQAENN